MNNKIRVPQVLVIDEEGRQLGRMSVREALDHAQARNLDLVEVNPAAKPPVCRLMDYGKYKYMQSKAERDNRVKRKPQELREVKVRPKIDDHDFEVKVKTVQRLIEDGDRVKITLRFRGREIVHTDLAQNLLKDMFESVQDVAMIVQRPLMEGRQMIMVLAPKTGAAQPQSKPQAPKTQPQAAPNAPQASAE
ncbi:translation initiation factor IF-3 [bacterium]|nr:translation initiation factor IF-3 [bacterium]